MPADVLFSAVILSYNSARYLETCVETLVTCLAGFEAPSEIHVFGSVVYVISAC